MCTHDLCFEQKNKKNITFFIWKLPFLQLWNIANIACRCFRNAQSPFTLIIQCETCGVVEIGRHKKGVMFWSVHPGSSYSRGRRHQARSKTTTFKCNKNIQGIIFKHVWVKENDTQKKISETTLTTFSIIALSFQFSRSSWIGIGMQCAFDKFIYLFKLLSY